MLHPANLGYTAARAVSMNIIGALPLIILRRRPTSRDEPSGCPYNVTRIVVVGSTARRETARWVVGARHTAVAVGARHAVPRLAVLYQYFEDIFLPFPSPYVTTKGQRDAAGLHPTTSQPLPPASPLTLSAYSVTKRYSVSHASRDRWLIANN